MAIPRHKRLKRPARLQAAKTWIPAYPGKNMVKGYRRHFAVDIQCAIQELQMLGVKLDAGYVEAVRRTLANVSRRRKNPRRSETLPSGLIEANQNFAYIVGYTEAGFPYGITWEEAEKHKPFNNSPHELSEHNGNDGTDLAEIPF